MEQFNLLPGEIWANIFSMMRQWSLLSSVCRRWRDIIHDIPRKSIKNCNGETVNLEDLVDYDINNENIRSWIEEMVVIGCVSKPPYRHNYLEPTYNLFFAAIASNSLSIVKDINDKVMYIGRYSFYNRLRNAVKNATFCGADVELLRYVLIDYLDSNMLAKNDEIDRYRFYGTDNHIINSICKYIQDGMYMTMAKIVSNSIMSGNVRTVQWFIELLTNKKIPINHTFSRIFTTVIEYTCITTYYTGPYTVKSKWDLDDITFVVLQKFIMDFLSQLPDTSIITAANLDYLFKRLDENCMMEDQSLAPYYQPLISTIIIGLGEFHKTCDENVLAVKKSIEYVNGIEPNAFGRDYRNIIYEYIEETYDDEPEKQYDDVYDDPDQYEYFCFCDYCCAG